MTNDIISDIIPYKDTILLIVGESVGPVSAKLEHYYANPGNSFWELLSLLIDKKLEPCDDIKVKDYGIGLTDIIKDKILLDGVDVNKIDGYFEDFVEKVKEINPKIILFNSKFSYKSSRLTSDEKAIRKRLNQNVEKFKSDFKDKYIIFQHISTSGSVFPKNAKIRLEQWKNLATVYKSFC